MITAIQEFLKMMTHKILNRDPKDEILKARRSWKVDVEIAFFDEDRG
jgi:hypothetical protein